jgi:hypothetical protein
MIQNSAKKFLRRASRSRLLGAGRLGFVINSCMEHKYLLAMARNTVTGQTQKQQDLTGARFTLAQRNMCQELADRLAQDLSARTGDAWQGFCQAYTPTVRRV